MFPASCDYRRASSIAEAITALTDHADRDAELIAGGHGLVPDMKRGDRAPDVLVDISRLDGLDAIEAGGDGVTVGPLVRHADLVDSEVLQRDCRLLTEAAEHVGDIQIRNRGTIGGNVADAESGADLPAAVLAADATIELRGPEGERSISVGEFFVGREETALAANELLTEIRFPADNDAGAYVRKTHPASGYAAVGVAAVVSVDDGTVTDARVATTGATTHAYRLPTVEETLTDVVRDTPGPTAETEAVEQAASRARTDVDDDAFVGDVHASADYRATLLSTYVERALELAVDRAMDGDSRGGDDS